jgi:hydrogenase expression/formation protein HypC
MCLATPMKIIKIRGNKAIVSSDKHEHEVDLSLIKNPKVGEYILAHGDMAINKLPLQEAKKILELIKNPKHL